MSNDTTRAALAQAAPQERDCNDCEHAGASEMSDPCEPCLQSDMSGHGKPMFVQRAALAEAALAAPQEPVAWMRRWCFDGEEPRKERNNNGRMAWPAQFKFLPVSPNKVMADDVPLYTPLSAPARAEPTDAEIEVCWSGMHGEDGSPPQYWDFARAVLALRDGGKA